MEIALVVAHDRQRAIGREGQLPWRLPDDLQHFKALTLGLPVLMGRRTYDSIGRPLPGRRNLILSRRRDLQMEGVEVVHSLEAAIGAARAGDAPTLMVIGGGEIYALALPYARRIHRTEVDLCVADADTWFPPLDPAQWRETSRRHHPRDERHAVAFDFVDMTRVVG